MEDIQRSEVLIKSMGSSIYRVESSGRYRCYIRRHDNRKFEKLSVES